MYTYNDCLKSKGYTYTVCKNISRSNHVGGELPMICSAKSSTLPYKKLWSCWIQNFRTEQYTIVNPQCLIHAHVCMLAHGSDSLLPIISPISQPPTRSTYENTVESGRSLLSVVMLGQGFLGSMKYEGYFIAWLGKSFSRV